MSIQPSAAACHFDAQNAADFDAITSRINAAISQLRADPKLKPKEETLAELSGCSRGTLRNRQWPIEALKNIKSERKAKKASQVAEMAVTPKPKKSPTKLHDDQLRLSRDEALRWKLKHDELLETVTTLGSTVDSLKSRECALEAEIVALKAHIAETTSSNAAILPIRRKKNKPEG